MGRVLHDEDLAAAILDRVLERGRFIHLDRPSGRTRHLNLDEVLPANSEWVRISGTHKPVTLTILAGRLKLPDTSPEADRNGNKNGPQTVKPRAMMCARHGAEFRLGAHV